MELVNEEILILVKDAGYPQNIIAMGQIWFDTIAKRHGVVIGTNTLYYFEGGFSTVSINDIKNKSILLQPTIQGLLNLMPGDTTFKHWQGGFMCSSAGSYFNDLSALMSCIKCYISLAENNFKH